ncbi:MAG: TetR/AcrR family transcriptional regulator [Oscillospiraceae bacterium]|nr:TetR/AcrR family transcriptional regulator [Oscillospiraceae bacterium]
MKKTDARVRYTRRVLKESFLTLLRDKPVNRITVKEVCELAELNRATFYAHYGDCFALMESIEQELLEAFGQSLRLIDSFDVSALISAIYAMIEQHETACRVLIFQGASPSVLGRMIDLARESSITYWRQRLRRASDEELEMLYTHLSNGLMHVVVDGYDKYDREDVIRFVNRIVKSSLSLFQ